jgi:dTDP-glucose 4,6-dehydratase
MWEKLRNSAVLIAGGSGFFGTWLLEAFTLANELFDLEATAILLTRDRVRYKASRQYPANNAPLRIVEGDVRTFQFSEDVDFVIHAASESYARAAPISDAVQEDVIVNGTRNLINVAKLGQARSFLFVSSGAVYGAIPSGKLHVSEEFAGDADSTSRSSYGAAKWAAETECNRCLGSDLAIKIARCFAFVGPYLPLGAHFAIGNFIRDGLAGGPILVSGDGTPLRSYLYMSDLSIWLWTVLLNGREGRAYNVGSERALSIAQIAEKVAGAFSPRPEIRIAKSAVEGAVPSRYVPSTQRARTELGVVETVTLEDAIALTLRWHGRGSDT